MTNNEIEQFALADLPTMSEYLQIPSISTKHQGIPEAVEWLQQKFAQLGATNVEQWDDQGGNPVVFAEFNVVPGGKTLLFYNHYDVQPAEPLDEWHSEPFVPTIRDGKLFARGASDDKGELMARLTAVSYLMAHGGLSVNVKFIVEGEEELGSPHIEKYVQAHADRLAADACIWECGWIDEADNFEVVCGLKGVLAFEMRVQTADTDIHSSYATYADSAAWRLIEALSSLRTDDERIAVEGFYDLIQPLTKEEVLHTANLTFSADEIKHTYGLRRPLLHDDTRYELVNGATMTINGITGGYQGKGLKTIVPKVATAKLDCRLAPGQAPEAVFQLIRKQLDHNGFEDVELVYRLGEQAFRTKLTDPFVQLNHQVATHVYGEGKVKLVPNTAGSGPAKQFVDSLQVPLVMVGINYPECYMHAPNENIRLRDYQKGSRFFVELLQKFANQ